MIVGIGQNFHIVASLVYSVLREHGWIAETFIESRSGVLTFYALLNHLTVKGVGFFG